MAIVVVGGSARGSGKTALVCGLIAALREFDWIAVKVTTHAHAGLACIYEETAERTGEQAAEQTAGEKSAAEQGADTARYLAAGARRAFLVSAPDPELGERLRELRAMVGAEADLIFESNRVVRHLQPDLCLAIEPDAKVPRKASFAGVERAKQATVCRAARESGEELLPGTIPVFQLADFARIPVPMREWLQARLLASAKNDATGSRIRRTRKPRP